jgi:7,8-dihydropterin-6-yl-methyl-4-(beta-D-ribofuranosyl)aminobenzene 5'-phosphate synthase
VHRLLPALLVAVSAAQIPPAPLEIQIVYDNTTTRKDLLADWGFSALVKFKGRSVLFDTGAKPEIFMSNMNKLGIKPESIERVVVSHENSDNPTGVYDFFKNARSMLFYFLDNFSMKAYSEAGSLHSKATRVSGAMEVVPGVYSTGAIAGNPPEQALVIDSGTGLVILTSCSHPGAARIVQTAKAQRKKDSVKLLIGGFHMYQWKPDQIAAVITDLQREKVESIAPAHCTGETAMRMMEAAWKSQFQTAGVGKRFVIN